MGIAPFLVPRPTLYAVAESIPFEFSAGVRAFYGEGAPNWGLDGPKTWLAAQLLWNPRRAPAELLETYYREFWQEAATPMRAFFDGAERAWRGQPRPGYWIKYYIDEHQALLFPPALREEMKNRLADAARVAQSEIVRRRVAFTRDAFAVTDAFAEFCAARDQLARGSADETSLMRLMRDCVQRKEEFLRAYSSLRKSQPLAIQTEKLDMYVRSDPTGLARLQLSRTASGKQLLAAEKVATVESSPPELLRNPGWNGLGMSGVGGSISFDWTGQAALGVWHGHGEPSEHRSVEWTTDDTSARAVRFTGCKQETLSQIRFEAVPGQTYIGRARVRARVSPGNATFLIVTFFDEKFEPFKLGDTLRLPAGDYDQWTELAVVATAPEKACYVGLGVRATNQVGDDFAEFSRVSLKVAVGP